MCKLYLHIVNLPEPETRPQLSISNPRETHTKQETDMLNLLTRSMMTAASRNPDAPTSHEEEARKRILREYRRQQDMNFLRHTDRYRNFW